MTAPVTGPRLTCNGAPLPLGPRIGRGGEGEIHAVGDGSGRAVKVYLQPDTAREAKVRAMIGSHAARACPDVAFPRAIVRHEDGRFAGFTMVQVTGHQPIHELIGASSRRRFFPGADWRFLVRVASNIARVMAAVHAAGIVVGDINSAGFLVSPRGTVKLIDADSGQIGPHRCRVGMPEYTPPELQGRRFDAVDRTADHDAFGLAVLLFQLLMLGRHPFAGVARGRPVPLDRAIGEGRFAFSQIADVGLRPPPHSLLLADLPRGIRLLFERAFLSAGGTRPTATEWVGALSDLEAALIACPARADHAMVPVSARCPWCRIERETGRRIFDGQGRTVAPMPVAHLASLRSEVDAALRAAKRHAGEGIEPPWHAREPQPGKVARAPVGQQHDAVIEADRALTRWRTALGVWEVGKLSEDLKSSVADLERFHAREPFVRAVATAHGMGGQIGKILGLRLLAGCHAAGVGAAVIARLAGYGVVSAADLTRARLAAIPGVGEKRIVALLLWRDAHAVAAETEVRRSARLVDEVRAAAAARVDRQRATLQQAVRRQLAALSDAVRLVQARAAGMDARLAAALRAQDQALLDLAVLAGNGPAPLPIDRGPGSSAAPKAPKRKKAGKATGKKKSAKVCTGCGAPMVKRWGSANGGKASVYYGCSAYPRCNGVRAALRKGGRP